MNQDTDLIAAQIASLPITAAERREALAYVGLGDALAGLFQAAGRWLDASPSLKPSYRDELHAKI